MFHTGRCGSTVLGQMLNDHSDVFWGSEIFERLGRISVPKDATRIIQRSQGQSISRVYGFETKYLPQQHLSEECLGIDFSAYVEFLKSLGFSRFILLDRRNYLRRAVSAEVGRVTKTWHRDKAANKARSVRIDLEAFRTGPTREPLLTLFERMDESRETALRHLPEDSLTLFYEDDIQTDPRVAYEKVCSFLGLADEAPEVKLQPTNPFPLQELIENYDEIAGALQRTRWEWMASD